MKNVPVVSLEIHPLFAAIHVESGGIQIATAKENAWPTAAGMAEKIYPECFKGKSKFRAGKKSLLLRIR